MEREKRPGYDFNKVTRLINGRENAKNMSGEKEVVARYLFAAINPDYDPKDRWSKRIVTPVDVRVYMGRSSSASAVYCSVWARSRKGAKLVNVFTDGKKPVRLSMDPAQTIHVSGRGSAGGYGYHKESAAIEDAFTSAGFSFEGHFGGCGDGPAEHAVEAVARFLGWTKGTVIRA